MAVSLLGDLTLFAALVTRLDELHLTLPQVGILFSIHRIIRIPLNPLIGGLADRVGRRPLFIAGMMLAVISTTGYGFAIGFMPFLIFRLAWGVAWALINTTGMTITMDISSSERRGQLAGVYNFWLWAGFALAPFLGGILVDQLPFRHAMFVLAACTGIGFVVSYLFLPETKPQRKTAPIVIAAPIRDRLSSILVLLRTLNWQAMVIMAIFLFTSEGLLLSSLSLLLIDRFGTQIAIGQVSIGVATAAGVMFMLRAVLAAATGPLAGKYSDRRGRLSVVIMGALFGAASLIILLYAFSLVGILAGILLSAVASSTGGAVLTAWVGDTSNREGQGAIFGWFAMAGDIGSGLGPLFALLIYPAAGLVPAYWLGVGLFIFSAIWINHTRLKARDAIRDFSI